MRTGAVRLSDLVPGGRRLTGGFHLAEDQRLMLVLDRHIRARNFSHLEALTTGRQIFRGPIFKRIYARDDAHGRPYVSAADLVQIDIEPTRFLSIKQHGSLLDQLRLSAGMILVTCSGMNLGKAIWAREDMDGLCASHDLIRIEPDAAKACPGYVFAFLASRFGNVAIRKQIYGGNIKHIEPHQLTNLPVPRIGTRAESQVHELIVKAAAARSRASTLLRQAQACLLSSLAIAEEDNHVVGRPCSTVQSSQLQRRLDAFYYSPRSLQARDRFDNARDCDTKRLEDIADVFIPPIFKRLFADDPEYGVPYLTGADVFQTNSVASRYLMHSVAEQYQLVVHKGTILVQEAGQLGGLIGRCVLAGKRLDSSAVTNNMVRIVARNPGDTGYLFALLASEPGAILLAREAAGSSIPHMDANRVRSLHLPWASAGIRKEVGQLVVDAYELRDQASEMESAAISAVEKAIEEAA